MTTKEDREFKVTKAVFTDNCCCCGKLIYIGKVIVYSEGEIFCNTKCYHDFKEQL